MDQMEDHAIRVPDPFDQIIDRFDAGVFKYRAVEKAEAGPVETPTD